MLAKLLTLVGPPVQVQLVIQETVGSFDDMRWEYCEPEVASCSPQRLLSKEYCPTVTVSNFPWSGAVLEVAIRLCLCRDKLETRGIKKRIANIDSMSNVCRMSVKSFLDSPIKEGESCYS